MNDQTPTKLLIAYDGSSFSDAAIEDLQNMGLPANTRATVLTLADIWMPENGDNKASKTSGAPDDIEPVSSVIELQRSKASRALEEAQSLADSARRRVLEMFPEWSVEAESAVGSPAWKIIEKAECWNADIVLLGSHGRSALQRLFLGSVSLKALTQLKCSVHITRLRATDHEKPLRLLIGVDGSSFSEEAVKAVASREWPEGTEARVVTAFNPYRFTGSGVMEFHTMQWVHETDQKIREHLRCMVDEVGDKLREKGLSVCTFVKDGEAKSVLLRLAEEWDVDCIFVGSMGLGAVERFIMGSVSTAVATQAHCSIEVVHKPEEKETSDVHEQPSRKSHQPIW